MQSLTKKIIIGSRGSDLALWQANFFQSQLNGLSIPAEIKIISTKGDQVQHLSFDKIEGKGFFTKEIEAALINKEIDIAIHSHKDLETKQPSGLMIAGVSYRENPAEFLLIHKNAVDNTKEFRFKTSAVIGTSSARRKSQIKNFRPDITIKDIRGNVPTRINKLRAGDFDAILLAAAGVKRLELDLNDLMVVELDPRLFVPAAAQGVLAYQTRSNDQEMIAVVKQLNHPLVQEEIEIERKILSGFGGGCHVPIGINTIRKENSFDVRVSYGSDPDLMARRAFFNCTTLPEALSKFEQIQKNQSPNSVLITKELSADNYLERACIETGLHLKGLSFIETEAITFELPTHFEWFFFSSSNAVHAFFKQIEPSMISKKKVAAYGESTSRALFQYLANVDFIAKPGQPLEVASEFKSLINGGKVLFPVSDISKKSIQAVLMPTQVCNVICYKTKLLSKKLTEEYEAVVFTSPSNVHGFHLENEKLNASIKIIALGSSTEKSLKNLGYSCQVADFPSEVEVFTLLSS